MFRSFDFDTSAAIFDRTDLRTLKTSYERALDLLEATRIVDADAKAELAKLVFHLGRDRIVEGTGLRYPSVAENIAAEAASFLDEVCDLALCA